MKCDHHPSYLSYFAGTHPDYHYWDTCSEGRNEECDGNFWAPKQCNGAMCHCVDTYGSGDPDSYFDDPDMECEAGIKIYETDVDPWHHSQSCKFAYPSVSRKTRNFVKISKLKTKMEMLEIS